MARSITIPSQLTPGLRVKFKYNGALVESAKISTDKDGVWLCQDTLDVDKGVPYQEKAMVEVEREDEKTGKKVKVKEMGMVDRERYVQQKYGYIKAMLLCKPGEPKSKWLKEVTDLEVNDDLRLADAGDILVDGTGGEYFVFAITGGLIALSVMDKFTDFDNWFSVSDVKSRKLILK